MTKENVQEAKKAYDKAMELQDMTEGATKYMVENHREPTINNLYLAEHSSTADGDRQGRGYYADGPVTMPKRRRIIIGSSYVPRWRKYWKKPD